jgi:hypothetical protein
MAALRRQQKRVVLFQYILFPTCLETDQEPRRGFGGGSRAKKENRKESQKKAEVVKTETVQTQPLNVLFEPRVLCHYNVGK